jgi:hypothetical protein
MGGEIVWGRGGYGGELLNIPMPLGMGMFSIGEKYHD